MKLAVRDNIPADKFIQHRFNSVEAGLVEAEGNLDQPNSSWTINLSVLWTSPIITPCDMAKLSHMLAEEIYLHQQLQMNPWMGDDGNKASNIFEDDSQEEMTLEELAFQKMDDLGNAELLDDSWNDAVLADSE